MRVLVTGGTGFVGKNLQLIKPDWFYLSSRQYDLTLLNDCEVMIDKYKPDAIIHLAARVGGIRDNSEHQAEYFYQNVKMNTNIIEAARIKKVNRVLCSLSTCAWPNKVKKYPFTEKDLFSGPPAETNFSYGYAKRMLQVQCVSYRKQYGLNYSTFSPCNLYGPYDHFGREDSHFIASMLPKVFNSDKNDCELLGTGKPLRQYLYVKDLCRIITFLLNKHNSEIPLIVAPFENFSIKQIAEQMVKKSSNTFFKYRFSGKLDGQYRKDGDNTELLKIIGDFKFTPLEKGLQETIKWCRKNVFIKNS